MNATKHAPIELGAFESYGLHKYLLRGIAEAGFIEPRPIQAQTIPTALEGHDVLGLAQTGTGKTAAFALPLLDQLLDERLKGPRALVLAPTRELATQIAEEMKLLATFTHLNVMTIYGGVSQRRQEIQLRKKPEVVVGCPGRVLDLLQQGVLRLDKVETLVLDEADHMFDMGFMKDIKRIIQKLPEDRQNLLFSATMPKEIRSLANELLYKPHVVELATSRPAATIDHALFTLPEGKKNDLLRHLLNGEDCSSAIVFTRTKHRAKRLAAQLEKAGYSAIGLQGNMSQGQRDRAMKGFRQRRFKILVATDIAARGIDVSNISHVINYDVPDTPEAYTHRIGRTGRSECEGVACTFVTGGDFGWVRDVEKMLGEPIQRRDIDGFTEAVREEYGKKKGRGGGGGGGGARRGGGGYRPARASRGGGSGKPRGRRG